MIADHNSYKGCRAWEEIKNEPKYSKLCVICGIEYDTKDAGHVLVILPDSIYPRILNIRGMRCRKLIKLVHRLGGILGLAHPFGVASSSAMGFKKMDMTLIDQMDFIEVFNTCEFPESNRKAKILAEECGLPQFAGSDSHTTEYIGMGATEITGEIKCNDDFITAVRSGAIVNAEGTEREITNKAKRKEHWTGILGFKIYNRGIGKLVFPYRRIHHRKMLQHLIQAHTHSHG